MKKCNRCNTEQDYVKTKIISLKTYTNICKECWKDITEKCYLRKLLINKRLSARMNIETYLEYSGIPTRYKLSEFKNYIDKNDNIKKFSGLRTTKEPVLIWSDKSGNGKTHLAVSLLKVIAWRGLSAKYITASMLMIVLRGSFNDQNSTESDIINNLVRVGVLVIDDIGVEKNTDYCMQCWYTVINDRYNECRPTIFTSNYSPRILADKLGNRIMSRISSGRIIKINGDDHRLL